MLLPLTFRWLSCIEHPFAARRRADSQRDMSAAWWTAAGSVAILVIAIGTFGRRARRPDLTLPPVSGQWLAYHKRDRSN